MSIVTTCTEAKIVYVYGVQSKHETGHKNVKVKRLAPKRDTIKLHKQSYATLIFANNSRKLVDI